jgi:hypothetical protein
MATHITQNLVTLATQLNTRLRRLEAQAPKDYYYAGAMVVGRKVHTWTHSYQPAQRHTLAEAVTYLATLAGEVTP